MKMQFLNVAFGLMLGSSQLVYADATTPAAPYDNYSWSSNLSEGSSVYLDRSFVFSNVPEAYLGADYLLTPNADKLVKGDAVLHFEVGESVTLFVAHDVRIDSKPDWLLNWTNTGEKLVTTDATLAVYSKDFAAGEVVIGGNSGISRSSMYSVFMLPQAAPADVEAPSQPTALGLNAISASALDLSWTPSSDNVGVAGYVVLRDGVELTTTTESSFVDQGLNSETAYSYSVMAFDEAGNLSLVSDAIAASTLPVIDSASSSVAKYQWGKLSAGQKVYTDRDFGFIDVPASLQGVDYVQTANADKLATTADFFSFNVNDAVTVFVARDSRIGNLPGWMADWTATGEQLVSSDATLNVYAKDFAAGTVTLGGNSGITRSSMYSVAVKMISLVSNTNESVNSTEDHMPSAQPDSVILDANSSATFNVLANDSGLEDGGITLSLSSLAAHGNVTIHADLSITYSVDSNYTGTDSFMYQITDADGDVSVGKVSIQIDAVAVKCNY